MLVGFPAGGPTDVVARLVSDKVAPRRAACPRRCSRVCIRRS
jgi:hypothetical protein